jgi:HSP20 family protein
MELVPYDPFKHLPYMRRDFDRFFSGSPISFEHAGHLGGIRVDVHETDHEVIATCDLPGLERKEDVDLDIENNQLHISGRINRAHEVKEENMHRRERHVGRFHRTITLPCRVSHEGVSATYKNGVLEVKMPKLIKDDKKKIDVQFH